MAYQVPKKRRLSGVKIDGTRTGSRADTMGVTGHGAVATLMTESKDREGAPMPDTSGSVELGIADLRVDVGDHIAYLWESEKDFKDAVRFLDHGLTVGDHVVVFGHEKANARVLKILADAGHDPEELEANGRLSVLRAESTGDATLDRIVATFQEAREDGAPLIRLLGNIGWGRRGWPEESELLAFEAKVTGAAAQFPSVVMCAYDLALTGSVIVNGAFCTHPLTIHRNLIRENPMYEDVEEFLRRIGEEEAAPEV